MGAVAGSARWRADSLRPGSGGTPAPASLTGRTVVMRGRSALWTPVDARLFRRNERYRPTAPLLARTRLMPFVSGRTADQEHTKPAWVATAVISRVAGLLDGRCGYVEDDMANA